MTDRGNIICHITRNSFIKMNVLLMYIYYMYIRSVMNSECVIKICNNIYIQIMIYVFHTLFLYVFEILCFLFERHGDDWNMVMKKEGGVIKLFFNKLQTLHMNHA